MINSFSGEYRWLSNFWVCEVEYDGVIWPSSEHAYQAAKSLDSEYKKQMLACNTPGQTKKLGKKVELRSDWDEVKLGIMEEILRAKFSNPQLREALLQTGTEELVEGNWWHDVYWGVCKGVGQNNLGKILMKLREEYSGNLVI